MKPQQAAPIITAIAPAALVAPPILVVTAIGLGLLWLLSGKDETPKEPAKTGKPANAPSDSLETTKTETRPIQQIASAKKIMREDLAEALAYGARLSAVCSS